MQKSKWYLKMLSDVLVLWSVLVTNVIGVVDIRTMPAASNEHDTPRHYFLMDEEFLAGGVCPNFLPYPPKKHCVVVWKSEDHGEVKAYGGNLLHRSMIMSTPEVTWAGDQGLLYTLILFHTFLIPHELEYPRIFNPWSHWIVGNIPGPCGVNFGEIISHYHVTNNPRDVWLHKHVAVIFRQKGPIVFLKEDRYTPNKSVHFNVSRFVQKYGLGDPEFGNFVYSDTELGLEPFETYDTRINILDSAEDPNLSIERTTPPAGFDIS